ncbi:MAG: LptF/LptG family permease [Planctomycetota bacterium]
MAFPWTLQKYIFREMGKSFLLTATALTGLLGLGGGVLEMVDLGEITPGQLFRLMLLMLPVAGALTLPMAALFSAASIYGRLSADNEFVACRSSGINLLVLFIPAVVLSLVSAAVTFAFSNFVIPGMVRNIENFISNDISAMVRQRLSRPRGITLRGKYRISADENAVDVAGDNEVLLRGVAFVEVDDDQWVRYGTAQEVRLIFEKTSDPILGERLGVRGRMLGLSSYDRKDRRFFEEGSRIISYDNIPQQLPLELKFLTINELLYYLTRADEWHEVQSELNRLRAALAKSMLLEYLWDDWLPDRRVVLSDERGEITVTSDKAVLQPGGDGIELYDVAITDVRNDREKTATAERAVIETTRADSARQLEIEVEAYEVSLSDGVDVVNRSKEMFGPVIAPAEVVAQIESMGTEQLLEMGSQAEHPLLRDRYLSAAGARGETMRRIVATINERMAFGISVVVLVLLGAALGIIFRGSHVMVAFGISFVPSLMIIIGIVMGKQMTYNEPTYLMGLGVLWSGIVFVAILDVWTLTRVLRR